MWELDYKKSWVPKNWCFLTVVLEKTLESPLVSKEVQPVHPKGDQSWVFIGRTPDAKRRLIWQDPDAGKDWGQEEKGTEDEMVGWHHQLNGHEFGETPGVDGQGDLRCCGPWGRTVRHDWATELNWTDFILADNELILYYTYLIFSCETWFIYQDPYWWTFHLFTFFWYY